jgi:hypothetical protein
MVRLEFKNSNAMIEGSVEEITAILKDLQVIAQSPRSVTPSIENQKSADASKIRATNPMSLSDEGLYKKIPDRFKIAEMLEAKGKPFSYTIVEQQKEIFGRPIPNKENQRLYTRFYDLHNSARNLIVKKHGGKWIKEPDRVDGKNVTRYKWVEDEKVDESNSQTVTPIIETQVLKEEQRGLLNY